MSVEGTEEAYSRMMGPEAAKERRPTVDRFVRGILSRHVSEVERKSHIKRNLSHFDAKTVQGRISE